MRVLFVIRIRLPVFDHQRLGDFLGAKQQIQNAAKYRQRKNDEDPEKPGAGILILSGYDNGDHCGKQNHQVINQDELTGEIKQKYQQDQYLQNQSGDYIKSF